MIQPIDRFDDPRIATYARVGDPAWLSDHGLFVAESRLVVRRLFESRRFEVDSLLVTPAALAALQDILGDLNDIAVARRLLAEIAPRGSAPGIAGAAAHTRHTLAVRERMLVISLEAAWAAFEKRRPFWKARA